MSDVTVREVPAMFQADCARCGWHSRPYLNRPTVERFAAVHEQSCPDPRPAPVPPGEDTP